MIVRDEAQTLRRCLESVRGVMRQIVIADTGSKDETRKSRESMGRRSLKSRGKTILRRPVTGHWPR